MPHIRRLGLLLAVGLVVPGCAYLGPSGAATEADVAFCVSEVNRYRVLAGMIALSRSAALDSFATESAEMDGTGISSAETELLRWRGASVHAIIEKGLSIMWQQGPGGEHYDIIAGPYSEIGCGIYIGASGVTVAQDYR
jgi:hypothetical protein